MRKLVLIDGNALLHRAYHAYPPLSTSKGELVNAVYGFSAMLLSVLEKLSPTHCAVAWDVSGPTFRKIEYDQYKAHRGPMDADLVPQIKRTKDVVEALNIPQFGITGYEADDIIGTLSKVAIDEPKEEDVQVVIVTGDRDALQLIEDKRVVVYLPIQNHHSQSVVFDEDKVIEKYGMKPRQIIDLKSLMGDASDNIPGVKGVGSVTATKLIQMFGGLEEIYNNIEDSRIAKRTKELLLEGQASARQSFRLAEINREVPLEVNWEDCLLSDYKKELVLELFEELNFKSLISKLPSNSWEKEVVDVFI